MTNRQDHEEPNLPKSQYMRGPEQEDEIDLAQLWGILWNGKWKIVCFIAAALILGVLYLFAVQPTYKADALLQIQSKQSSALTGLTSDLKGLVGSSSTPAQSIIPIIKSRTVLRKTVEDLGLAVVARPQYLPIFGQAIAAHSKAEGTAEQAVASDSGTWLTNYAWAPVSLSISNMEVPRELLGKPFTLRALGGDHFVLYGPQDKKILSGSVGKSVTGQTAKGKRVELFVAGIKTSAPPTDYTLIHNAWLPVVEGLQARLNISEQGEETGVLHVSLTGKDRHLITKVVNSVANHYLRQNVEAHSKQAEESLAFLQKKLPKLRKQLRAAEAELTAYLEKKHAIDLDAEGQALLDRIVSLANKRSKLKLKLAELKQTYTSEHPAVESVREQMQSLKQAREKLKKKVGSLPKLKKKMLRLQRNVEVNTRLYTTLLKRAQELRVIKAGKVSNVRIVDQAVVPLSSVAPQAKLVLALALVLGALLGCGFVFLQAALRRGIDDPKEIENALGLSVYAVIPFSSWLLKNSRRAIRLGERRPILARDRGDDTSVEALRSLRTSLYFTRMDSGSNSILITGPSPNVGKSFISVNLAYLLSEVEENVVIVDGDMRKGRVHEYLPSLDREPGLSQVLSGQKTLEEALRSIDGTNIKVLTSGKLPPNPSELLMREEFAALMEQLKTQFDSVVIDAPPIMAVTDAAIIGASVPGSASFLVARAGMHPASELEASVNRMRHHDHNIAGVVFNAYTQKHASYGGGYHYQYEYKKQN